AACDLRGRPGRSDQCHHASVGPGRQQLESGTPDRLVDVYLRSARSWPRVARPVRRHVICRDATDGGVRHSTGVGGVKDARVVRVGLAAGVAGVLAVARLLAALLFGVSGTDLTTLSAAVAMLTAIAGLASALPAWRASRVEPIVALRHE